MAQLNQSLAFQSNAILSLACYGLAQQGGGIVAGAPGSQAWPTANKAIYIPFRVFDNFTAKRIVIYNHATINGNVCVAIYNSSSSRLVTSGSVAHAGANADQVFDITDTALVPALYYMGIAFDNNTATIAAVSAAAVSMKQHKFGVREEAAAFPLPATATFADTTLDMLPVMAILGF